MTLDDLQHWLTRREWRSAFDPRTLQRGRNYAARGHVRKLELRTGDKTGCTLLGRVKGSGGNEYGCIVTITPSDRWLAIDARCSCPVGVDCKHAAALLLHAIGAHAATDPAPVDWRAIVAAEQARSALADWDHWLATLDRTASPSPPMEAERRFGLLLRSAGSNDQLLVLPAWMRPSRARNGKAAWVAPQTLLNTPEAGPQPAPAEGWPDDMAFALAVLMTAPTVNMAGHAWYALHSSHTERALEMLLARYPVWFERGEQPLERGPALDAHVRWMVADDGSQRPRMQVDAPDTRLLLGAGLWYVQIAPGRYGRVAGDAQLFRRLQYAPVLKPGQVAAVGERLVASAAQALPAPVDPGPTQEVRVPPSPRLQLHVAQARHWNGTKRDAGVASLRFDYAGHEIDTGTSGDAARVLRHDAVGLHAIQRDLGAERDWAAMLSTCGLTSATALYGNYRVGHGAGQERDWVILPNRNRPPLAPEDWSAVIPRLEQRGFLLAYADDFPHETVAAIDAWHAGLEPSGNAWFDVSLGVDVAGERVDLLPVLRQLIADPAFPRTPAKGEKKKASWRVKLDATRVVELPLAQLRSLIEPLLEWLESEHDGAPRLHATQLDELDASALPWHGGEALRGKLQQLRTRKQTAKPPRGFKATLRPYQQDGLAWLDFLAEAGLGGILADDMGLGKTVQVLAHILGMKQRKQLAEPALVVCPTSLVGNWQAEAARFAPTLKVLVLHGADRAERYDDIAAHDLVVTTYPLLPRDRDKLVEARFSLLVLDEAQTIKNAASQAAQVVREIPAARRLAMTGTPLENHLGELWAQFDAVEPGLLGSQRQFARSYRTPIEKHADAERRERLSRRIKPLLLRRRKDEVLAELPPKTEIVHTLELEGEQRALYETLRLAQHERVRQAVAERGLAQSGIIVLDALLKLRQACCDPRLVKLPSARRIKQSAKLDALLELLDGLLAEGRRVLLFSQFTEMLALIEGALQKRKIAHQTLTGQTPARERSALVKRFQAGDVPVFLISLKAGGVGLNLTAADTVIHYDPWWNPAVEAQATDRAHRIGQDKAVFVYRLICTGTVEEKIQALQARKADLAQAVLDGGGASQRLRFDEKDLAELFAPM